MANQEIQRKNGVFKLFKRGKEIMIDLILLLPYVVMFFIYMLLTFVVLGVVIVVGFFITLKKIEKNVDYYDRLAVT